MSTRPPPTDHGGMEVLTMSESFELFTSVPVGRFAFVEGGQPIVLPVNFAVDDEEADRLETLGLEPWAHNHDRSTRWIRFRPSEVSGRHIVRLTV